MLQMQIKPLLKNGYFPKELPPPFTTAHFSNNFDSIESSWKKMKSELGRINAYDKSKYKKSLCALFSIPKGNYSRRYLEIPNPFHHSILCKTICDNWTEIDNFCNDSTISLSRPIINKSKGRAVIPLENFSNFKQKCLVDSYDKMYELKTDISWFYPTLYTHTIPWALHGKDVAKKNNSKDLLGNELDTNTRNCKHGQTTGIPIGPDTSLIIAEIVTCGIDQILKNKLGSIKGYRYYDDMYFYFSNREEAEKGLKHLQYILTDFQLSINEEKTNITKFPSTFDENWVLQINSFVFRNNIEKQEHERALEQKTDIERYFKLTFYLANKYSHDSVLSYAMKRFVSVPIMNNNWNLFESLILKTVILDPLLLKQIVPFLVAYSKLVDIEKICNVVEEIIKNHAPMGHSFEISWALWLAKTFEINIDDDIAKDIFESNDVISIIIALDLKNMGLINSSLDLSALTEILTEDSLFEEKWILIYESIFHNWLTPKDYNPLEIDNYFKILNDADVKFYDETIKAKPFKIKGLEEKNQIDESPQEAYPEEEYAEDEYPDEFPDEYLSYM